MWNLQTKKSVQSIIFSLCPITQVFLFLDYYWHMCITNCHEVDRVRSCLCEFQRIHSLQKPNRQRSVLSRRKKRKWSYMLIETFDSWVFVSNERENSPSYFGCSFFVWNISEILTLDIKLWKGVMWTIINRRCKLSDQDSMYSNRCKCIGNIILCCE